MRKTLNVIGSCLVIVGLVLMIGAAGMNDTCTGSLECVITRMLWGLAFLVMGSVASGVAESQRRGDK